MSTSKNDRTLRAYENGLNEYNAAMLPAVSGAIKDWLDAALDLLPKGAHVLEIGSAHGRDADYIESKGFLVERTDAAKSFIRYLESKRHAARFLNALTDDYGGPYDLIYANAVLVHFTHEECKLVLLKSIRSLAPSGVIAFSVKVGRGAGWSESKLKDPRYFTYWQMEPLQDLVRASGFDIVYFQESSTGHNAGVWFHVIARVKTN